MSKLALGTVQFGLDYGVSNTTGKTTPEEVSSILEYASRIGIDTLDTAPAYGNSEDVLGACLGKTERSYRIVSKLPADFTDVASIVNGSLAKLHLDSFYGYLYHNFNVFFKHPESLDDLQKFRDAGKIRKIGFSLYKTEELEYLLKNKISFDIVQVPYSIFDRRFAPVFPKLKEMNVEIHIRSAFLQGLAFLDPESINPFFSSVVPQLRTLRELAQRTGLSLADVCLLWCTQNELIDKVVIGVNTKQNLVDNFASVQRLLPPSYSDYLGQIEIKDESILLPYLWKKV